MARPRKYRLWTDEEKRSICLQTRGPGVSVAQVARRYAMNANLIFKWLRDPRFNPPLIEDCTASFLPVEVVAVPPIIDPPVIVRIPMKAATDSDGKAATHSDPKRPLFQRSELAGVIVAVG